MKWPWAKRSPPLEIPPYRPIDVRPLEPKDPDYVVTETEMTQTGMFRIFPWLKDKNKPKE
jgi:hypothetical protein